VCLSAPSKAASGGAAASSDKSGKPAAAGGSGGGGGDTITVIDNRSGKQITVPIKHNTVEATEFKKLAGMQLYDPGFMNTCSATSRICEIQGGKGILRYRGFPIEQLAERSTFLEVAFLLIYGELPAASQLSYFTDRVMRHTFVHEDLKKAVQSFRYDAHPMGMLISLISALSTFHPEANPALVGQDVYKDVKLRNKQIHRIIGCIPTMAAFVYRHRIGRPFVNPSGRNMSYCENFLFMLDKSDSRQAPHPAAAKRRWLLMLPLCLFGMQAEP
jgi:citrate synthase